MKHFYPLFLLSILSVLTQALSAQITLSGASYTENFNTIGGGLPAGWSVRNSATATNLGTVATFTATPSTRAGTGGGFKNYASANSLPTTADDATQAAHADRALGVRQTGTAGTGGDPGAAFVLQIANTTGFNNFSLQFNLQSLDPLSPRVTTWRIDYGTGATPTSFILVTTNPANPTTGGTTFSNNVVTVNFGSALDQIADNVWIRIVALNASTGSGSRATSAIDDVVLTYLAGADVTPPTVTTLSPANNVTDVSINLTATITFSETMQKGIGNITVKRLSDNAVVQTYNVASASVTVAGNNVSFPLTLVANTGYYVEVDAGAFKDLAGNNFAGIAGNTTWRFTTGTRFFVANFNTCTAGLSDGFTQFSVTGAQLWACTTFGRDPNSTTASAPNGLQINGFAGGTNVVNEDWLISPAFNLTGTTFPILSFWSRTAFNGAPLLLKVSTNYSGAGDPRTATWTDVNGRFPNLASDVWTEATNINLAAFKQPNVYIAWVYNSSGDDGARWTLDDISLNNSATAPPAALTVSTNDVQFGFVASGGNAVKTFTVSGNDITTDITVTASGNFQVSADGITFGTIATYTQATSNNIPRTVFVRFTPTQADQNYTGTVTVQTSSLSAVVTPRGTSVNPDKTLEVVNWNIEWFGSPTLGPTNDALQEQNARTIMQNINADIYAVSEIVDTARLGNLTRSLNGYSYVISNFGSHTNTAVNPAANYANAQKLGFIYKTNMFGNISTTALLSKGINTAADASSVNYNNWSSGRYPFMMSTDVTLQGVTKNIKFVVVHAKANTSPTITSYQRRKDGADTLHAFLTANFPTDNIIVLGDFNDDLDQTITAGITPPVTSYITFFNDSVNFPALTLPLSRAGKKSTVSYNDIIDHVVVSNEMAQFYMRQTANILTDVTSMVSSYGTTTSDHYPVFTRYAFDPAILPVTLLEFTGIRKGNTAELQWKTAQEINTKVFVVERSLDGRNFTEIGTMNAAGNSAVLRSYTFVDNTPANGRNFYRLKSIDKDDKFTTTGVIALNFGTAVYVSLKPNPASSVVYVTMKNSVEPATIQLVDINGKIVKQQFVSFGAAQSIPVSLGGIAKGIYLLKISTNKEVISERLLIQ